MRTTLIVVFALCLNACEPATQYKDATEFQTVVQSWNLVGKSETEVISFLTKQNFLCKEHYCYREIKGLVCNQKLKIDFVLNKKKKIIKASVWKLPNGQLPSVCL